MTTATHPLDDILSIAETMVGVLDAGDALLAALEQEIPRRADLAQLADRWHSASANFHAAIDTQAWD